MASGFSINNKIIFIHIPKCAGSSIAATLFRDDSSFVSTNRHSPLSYFKKHELKEIYAEMFKFAFVRNPFNRLVSAFLYCVEKIQDPNDYHWDYYKEGFNIISQYLYSDSIVDNFNAFVQSSDFNKITEIGFPVHFKPQIYFLLTGGILGTDFLGRFENLNNDFSKICKKIGVKPVSLPHTNKSYFLNNYRQFYNNKSYGIVREKYHLDFRFFGYK